MLRPHPSGQVRSLMQTKPRKMLKIDIINNIQYNQFEGNSQLDVNQIHQDQKTNQKSNKKNKQIYNGLKGDKQFNEVERKYKYTYQQQVNQNQKLFMMIKGQNFKLRKIGDEQKNNKIQIQKNNKNQILNLKKQTNTNVNVKKQTSIILNKDIPKIKLEQGTQNMINQTKKQQKQKQKINQTKTVIKLKDSKQKTQKQILKPSSNWSKFLQQSSSNKKNSNNNLVKTGDQTVINKPSAQTSKFIAIDCQFVRCDQVQTLARVSIVSQDGQTLYDSYIRPQEKITDYLTAITGITYSHIKNAPFWKDQVKKVKKILINKIVIGHTIHKDLSVMKLDKWTGISKSIDVAEFSLYKQKNGSKVASLKRLTANLLSRNIQAGWHSSVEDAVATIDLFKINKKKILKQNKLI